MKYEFRYDAAHSADILFIVALNLLLWGGVAVLCATLEYNVKVNVCVSIRNYFLFFFSISIISIRNY